MKCVCMSVNSASKTEHSLHALTGMSVVSRTMAGTCLADSSLLIADLTFLTSSSEKLKEGENGT